MKFIRMWLNDGTGPHGSVLKKETIEAAVRNGLEAHQAVVMLPGVIATPSNDAEFFPGLKKSWCYTFTINDEDAPTGRPAGALGWAGLANLFYWIDRKNRFRLLGDADSAVRRPDFVRWLPGFRDGRLFESSGARGSISGGRLPTARLLPKRKAEECEREVAQVFVKTIGTEHFRGPRAGVLLLGLGGHLQNFDPKSLGQSDQGSKLAGGRRLDRARCFPVLNFRA
jgi:hypothetical protein